MQKDTNKLISDVIDAISTGHNFGGWTDSMDERVLGQAEARAVNRNQREKNRVMNSNQQKIDKYNHRARIKRVNAQQKDDRLRVNSLRNR